MSDGFSGPAILTVSPGGATEIMFAHKPDESVRGYLKAMGYRWSRWRKLWYAPPGTFDQVAKALADLGFDVDDRSQS